MRKFDYSYLADRTWDNEIISYISKIHEYKGKQELFLRQKPVELNRLIEIAKIQSTEASNRIEGIITTNANITTNAYLIYQYLMEGNLHVNVEFKVNVNYVL